MLKEGFSDKLTFEQRFKGAGDRGSGTVTIWRKNIPGKRISKREAMCLLECFDAQQRGQVAGAKSKGVGSHNM